MSNQPPAEKARDAEIAEKKREEVFTTDERQIDTDKCN
jgi:hypothetical protein